QSTTKSVDAFFFTSGVSRAQGNTAKANDTFLGCRHFFKSDVVPPTSSLGRPSEGQFQFGLGGFFRRATLYSYLFPIPGWLNTVSIIGLNHTFVLGIAPVQARDDL